MATQIMTKKADYDISKAVTHSWMEMTPEHAAHMLEAYKYCKQRDSRKWITDAYGRLHMQDKFDGRIIYVVLAVPPSGKKQLVNGQHTLITVRDTEKPLWLNLMTIVCRDNADVDALYVNYDSQARRSTADKLRAAGYTQLGLPQRQLNALTSAACLIDAEFSMNSKSVVDNAAMLASTEKWSDPALMYFEAMMPMYKIHNLASAVVNTGGVMVGLLTLKHEEEKAKEFWKAVAVGSDAVPQAKLLREHYISQIGTSSRGGADSTQTRFQRAARAWNAFMRGKHISALVAKEDWDYKIAGVPMDEYISEKRRKVMADTQMRAAKKRKEKKELMDDD